MKRAPKYLGIAALTLVVIAAALYLYGASLPKTHVATVRGSFDKPRAEVWDAIYPPDDYGQWMPEVASYERLDEVDGKTRYRETNEYGTIVYVFDVVKPGVELLVRTERNDMGFTGLWTYRLEDRGSSTVVTIVEEGAIESPMLRAIGRFAFTPDETARIILGALGDHLGTPVERLETVSIANTK